MEFANKSYRDPIVLNFSLLTSYTSSRREAMKLITGFIIIINLLICIPKISADGRKPGYLSERSSSYQIAGAKKCWYASEVDPAPRPPFPPPPPSN